MKPRDYCCCAIPTINAGIYAALTEQFVLGVVVGVLSVATPSIVGAATPSFAPWILAVLAFVAAGVQVFGFFGVRGERPIMYRRYVTLHGLITLAAFAVAAAWVIISASRHSTAESNCKKTFFANSPTDSTLSSQADILCNIFPWVDVGIMGGLWVFLAVVHVYFYVVISSYGTGQRRDHEKYNSVYDSTNALAGNIPTDRNDPWDSRNSTDSLPGVTNTNAASGARGYSHVRQDSNASTTDILNSPMQKPKDMYADAGYGSYSEGTYPPQSRGYMERKATMGSSATRPAYGYSQDPRQQY
ncbi:hypothetical protein HGRIS_007820 [Hohenbuehelia grisea]|uniref:Transmembrane protein n=1 Tax=Hohenbuehelia grisea TaxID=104357 RepID=A0ABR3J621_9AGAR